MIVINDNVKVMTDNIEEKALGQVIEMANHPAFIGSKIRIQADCHAGAGCVIGFTSKIEDKVIPNVVGVDLGCGMLTVELGKINVDYQSLDTFIRNNIPHGKEVNSTVDAYVSDLDAKPIKELCGKLGIGYGRPLASLGSLGGGNHFIEVGKNADDVLFLVIHSGSRNLGLQTAKYHQQKAVQHCKDRSKTIRTEYLDLTRSLRSQGSHEELKKITMLYDEKAKPYKVRKDLAYLEGEDTEEYLKDAKIARDYASLNREIMARRIVRHLGLNFSQLDKFETIHNYISDDNVVRKGAISAHKDEKVLIPMNMRDGSILAKGKGNPDYNCSAPHGAGRLMSRSKAKEALNLEEFENSMSNVWTSCVKQSTLDEAPMAYKNMSEIIENTKETIEIIDILKPVYNFKAN